MQAGRLHTALVYFGLRDDPALLDRLDTGPPTTTRIALGALAVLIGLALALGVLALAGARLTWSATGEALVVAGVVLAVSTALRRRRRHD